MPGRLKQELRQKQPFRNSQQEAFLNILRTADLLQREVESLFSRFGITSAQYNVLRILHGAGGGRSCSDIRRRMVEHHPDVTRLLDRMESAGLIRRERETKDRRTVIARITLAGTVVLKQLQEPLNALHQQQFAALSPPQLLTVIEEMERIRLRNRSS
jgi:DNA-binding MarR family transcriptional regulator